ncbi:hypothetical protein HJG60_012210 [Phyllostomus discolor]|uniref:Uncharacterized protein n=1 Tax=Phyllostomus discolor TaxID=89673 RepID=A0A833Z669_9CHIR|nr:hypothetical protein HJG60_012210 [Phyllostomus discolor]
MCGLRREEAQEFPTQGGSTASWQAPPLDLSQAELALKAGCGAVSECLEKSGPSTISSSCPHSTTSLSCGGSEQETSGLPAVGGSAGLAWHLQVIVENRQKRRHLNVKKLYNKNEGKLENEEKPEDEVDTEDEGNSNEEEKPGVGKPRHKGKHQEEGEPDDKIKQEKQGKYESEGKPHSEGKPEPQAREPATGC